MVDLSSSLCKRLPEGTSYNAMYTDAWIANLKKNQPFGDGYPCYPHKMV